MPKTTCSCADDSEKQFTNNAPNFFTFNHFDNKFVPRFQNPSRTLRDIIADSSSNYVIDRANCLTCDETVTTQQKLLVRKKDRPTPFRVPYNHYRKVSSCNTSDCLPNVKINKDISCNEIQNCESVNYAIYRQVDKFGIRNLNNGGNYKNYLQIKGKNYKQNTFGILPECAIPGKEHTYKIGSVEDLVYNLNSNTQFRENCQLGYEIRSSKQEKKYSIIAMNTTTRKYSNPYHNTSGSVSSRAHINKKKFRNILAGQRIGKDGYNNCINGQLCSLYMAPGPNTKLISSRSIQNRCLPPRIRGLKQRCTYLTIEEMEALLAIQNKCKPQQKSINPQFQRFNYITGQQPGYLKITFNHCELTTSDKVEFTFTGASVSSTSIFTNNSGFINASSSVTLVHTNKQGNNTTLTVTDFFVDINDFFFYYPIDVTEGTTQITIDDGSNNIHLNNVNGPVGRIYANVKIPLHNNITSAIAWDISTVCTGRNGTIIYNDVSATNDWITTDSSYQNVATVETIPPQEGIKSFGPFIRIKFKVVGDNLKSGDVFKVEFYTTYDTGFFTGTTAINTFVLNGTGYNNPVLYIAENTTTPSASDIVSNAISSASWDGSTSNVTISALSGTWYLQTLNITIATTLAANDPTDANDYYIINLTSTLNAGYSGGADYYSTFIFSPNPSTASTVRYELSCNCFTQTVNNSSATTTLKQAKAWEYNNPGAILSFLSSLPTNFYARYSSNNTDLSNNVQHQKPIMSWFSYKDKAGSSGSGEGSTSSGYIPDPKWINTSGDLVDISNVNQKRFHKVRFYTSKQIPAGSEIVIKFKKQKNVQPGGGITGYFGPEFEPAFYSYTPQTRGAEKYNFGSGTYGYLPIPYDISLNGTYQDFFTFILSGLNHAPGNNNNWNVMHLQQRSVASDGTLSTTDVAEKDIRKYTITPSTHRSSFGGQDPGVQVLTITTDVAIDARKVVEIILYDNNLLGYDGFNHSFSTGNVYHTLSWMGTGPGSNVAARPMGLFQNGPTDVPLISNNTSTSAFASSYLFNGKHFEDAERDGYKVSYDIDISNNGFSLLQSTVSNETAFYWKSMSILNNYSDFPKYANITNIVSTTPSYFIKTLPDLSSLPSSFNPTTIRFNHRTSIPKDSIVQIIFSTENFPYGIDSSGNNVNIPGETNQQGDYFGKGFFNPKYESPDGTTGISNMTEGSTNNVKNWNGSFNSFSNVGTDQFGIRVLNKIYGNTSVRNLFIKDIIFKRLEDVSRNTYTTWHDGKRLSKGPFIQDIMQFTLNDSVEDTNGTNYFDIQLVDGRNEHNGSNHTQNNSFQSWLPRIENDVDYSGNSKNYKELASCFYITIMIREPINDEVIASIVRHKIDMT